MTAIDITVLDRYDPNWPFGIDEDRLDISSPDDCIVGQRYGGNFKRQLLELFGCHDSAPRDAYAALNRTWRETVRYLRATRKYLPHLPVTAPPVEEMSPVLNGWFLDKDEACTNQPTG